MTTNALRLSPAQRFTTHAVILLLCIPAALPLLWMVSTSFKGDAQLYGAGTDAQSLTNVLLPWPVRWQNYPAALEAAPLSTYLKNTLLLCVLTVFGAVFSSAMVAYRICSAAVQGKGRVVSLDDLDDGAARRRSP